MIIHHAPTCGAEQAAGPRPFDDVFTLAELEARHITRALEVTGRNQRRAARLLGITRWSLARRVRKYGLEALLSHPYLMLARTNDDQHLIDIDPEVTEAQGRAS